MFLVNGTTAIKGHGTCSSFIALRYVTLRLLTPRHSAVRNVTDVMLCYVQQTMRRVKF